MNIKLDAIGLHMGLLYIGKAQLGIAQFMYNSSFLG